MRLHRRAHGWINVPFEMLGEEHQDVGAHRAARRLVARTRQDRSECLANRHPRTVQAALYGVDADSYDTRDLWSGQTLDVAEHEDLALSGLESVDGER